MKLTALRTAATRLLLAIALAAAIAAAIVVAIGGWRVEIAGVQVSLTSPWRPALLAALSFILYAWCAPQGWRGSARVVLSMRATVYATALAIAVSAAGWYWGSRVAGGADSSCYLSQAGLWRSGRLVTELPLIASSPWPLAVNTWAPLGFTPVEQHPSAIVPVCPPGLPIVMAGAQSIGGFCAAFMVVPLCGGLLIWLTYLLGRRLFEPAGVALWAALLLAESPVMLFQLMNPMTDVPVTAALTLALLLAIDRRPLLSGLAMSLTIAIRPNLVPVALIPWVWIASIDRHSAVRFAAGIAPSVVGIAVLNAYLYGSPLLSGYGSAADLYSISYVLTNLRQYSAWLLDAETPIVVFAGLFFVAPAMVGPPRIRSSRLLLGGVLGAVALSYLFYIPFEIWTYLRFLLPAWPIMMILSSAGVLAVLRRLPRPMFGVAVAIIVTAVAFHSGQTAIARGIFQIGSDERKYADVSRYIADHTDADAVMVSMQYSGAIAVYTGRQTLRFDQLDPLWLDRAVDSLQSSGRHPYFVLQNREIEIFRQRFRAVSRLGALDWNPTAALPGAVFVFDSSAADAHVQPATIESADDDCYAPGTRG